MIIFKFQLYALIVNIYALAGVIPTIRILENKKAKIRTGIFEYFIMYGRGNCGQRDFPLLRYGKDFAVNGFQPRINS
jgi:hypothetical protein